MSKIKVLYNMVKVLKEEKTHEGNMTLKIKENDVVLLNVMGSLSKDSSSDDMIHTLNVKGQIDELKIDHESRTVTNGLKHQKHACGRHKHFHHHGDHDMLNDMKPGKLDKMMFALDVINRMEVNLVEEKKVISLTLTKEDMPEQIVKMMQHKMMHRMHTQQNAMDEQHEALYSKMAKFHEMTLESIDLNITLDEDYRPLIIQASVLATGDTNKVTFDLSLSK